MNCCLLIIVPSDGNDVSLTALEEAMKKYGKKSECTKERPWRGVCFLLPILNNPIGTSFSEGMIWFLIFDFSFRLKSSLQHFH